MAALLYTTTEGVRAALGLDENDVADSVLQDQKLDLQIKVELEAWLPDHAVIESAGQAPGASTTDVTHWEWLQLYCLWWGAYLLASAPYAVPMLHHDGKSQVRRFNVDASAVANHAALMAVRYRRLLEEALELGAARSASMISISRPDYDPVTGR